jgi:hypothetical protein
VDRRGARRRKTRIAYVGRPVVFRVLRAIVVPPVSAVGVAVKLTAIVSSLKSAASDRVEAVVVPVR